MDESKDYKVCRNCESQSELEAEFCAVCGQKYTDERVRFTSLIYTFLYSVFNADSSLWKSLKHIWIPGKLTTAYFSGRRKSYLHPARLFFFSWVLFFAIFSYSNQDGINLGTSGSSMIENRKQDLNERRLFLHLLEFRDSLANSDTFEMSSVDFFLTHSLTELRQNWETGDIDSLKYLVGAQKDTFRMVLGVRNVDIAWEDIITMEDDELLEKYEITGSFEKLLSRQVLKMTRETTTMTNYLIGGISWMVFILIPGISLLLYLMYFYRGFYYVEHLVFSMHCHVFLFLSFLAVWLLDKIINFYPELSGESWVSLTWLYVIAGLASMIYPIIGLRTFYKSRIIGVIVKGYIAFNVYGMLTGLSILLAVVLRFMVF